VIKISLSTQRSPKKSGELFSFMAPNTYRVLLFGASWDINTGEKMDKQNLVLTKEGLEKLKNEMANLVDIKRPEIAKRIQDAREMGDISENSEYDAAKQEQAFIEGRISEIDDILKNAKVTDSGKVHKDSVDVGAKVTVHIDSGDDTFYIVGAPEADPMAKKISHESPLGSALMGKKVGEKIEVEAPVGKLTYTIVKIEY
jgi:transcription elongation factor GreA